jgi:hypothetical protein
MPPPCAIAAVSYCALLAGVCFPSNWEMALPVGLPLQTALPDCAADCLSDCAAKLHSRIRHGAGGLLQAMRTSHVEWAYVVLQCAQRPWLAHAMAALGMCILCCGLCGWFMAACGPACVARGMWGCTSPEGRFTFVLASQIFTS